MLKRFLSYYKPHKKLFAADMAASLTVALIAMGYPILTRQMLGDYIPNQNYTAVLLAALALLAVYGLRWALNWFVQYKGHDMGVMIQARMRTDLFKKIESLPFSYFDGHDTGKIMSRLTGDLFEVSELAHHGPEVVLTTSVSVIASVIYLFFINWKMALIILICLPLLCFTAFKLRANMARAFKMRREANAEINGALQSSISGIRVTKAFTNAEKEEEKFEQGNGFFMKSSRLAYRAMAKFHSTTTFITDVFNVVLLIGGGIFLYRGEINFADYSAFIVSVNLFLNPVLQLVRWMEDFQNGAAGFERFCEIMDLEPEKDAEDAKDVGRLRGEIELKEVYSRYDNGKEVLQGMSLRVGAGETFALVGPSGGGKTTICHLIPGFYEIAGGAITIDGTDIRSMTRASLRRNIGIVQQDIYLFNASIRDNILYGRLDASEEEVIEAAKRANIHEFVLSLPEGYDTVIGERGVRLSGGQKQRLCIARVFLKNPPILILDEATSALDNTTEIAIQKALDELCIGRTTLVVAHRLSTIKNADEIAYIENGTVTELGRHDALMAQNGAYARLYKEQFRE